MIRLSIFVIGLGSLASTPLCFAQSAMDGRPSAADAITHRIKAQARMIEGQQKKEKVFSGLTNPIIKSLADSSDLETKLMSDYFERKKEANYQKWDALEEQIENSRRRAVEEKVDRLNIYELTISQTDLQKIRPGIRSGGLINRLFTHINDATGLTYDRELSPAFMAKVPRLNPAMLKALRFTRASRYGPIAASLVDTMPEILDRWPYASYEPTLRPHVRIVTNAAKAVFQSGVSMEERFELEKLFQAKLLAMKTQFLVVYPPLDRRRMTSVQVGRILNAETYFDELQRVVITRAETDTTIGDEFQSYFQLHPPEQRNIATLIQYTHRYGLELQKAEVGLEHRYDELFEATRNFANLVGAAPTRESILEPIINVDLDVLVRDPDPDNARLSPALRPTAAK